MLTSNTLDTEACVAETIGLVEAGGSTPARQKFWEENFPKFNVVLPGGVSGRQLAEGGDVFEVELATEQQPDAVAASRRHRAAQEVMHP